MKTIPALIAALCALLLLPACSSGDDGGDGSVASDDGGGEALVEPDLGAPEESVEEGGAGRDEALPAVDLPGIGPKVIQTATLGVVVEDGRFDDAVRQARAIAA